MTDEHHSITLDYERTIEELRHARTTLINDLDTIVDACDALRAENKTMRYQLQTHTENSRYLLATIDQLRSENERLKIALQTGER